MMFSLPISYQNFFSIISSLSSPLEKVEAAKRKSILAKAINNFLFMNYFSKQNYRNCYYSNLNKALVENILQTVKIEIILANKNQQLALPSKINYNKQKHNKYLIKMNNSGTKQAQNLLALLQQNLIQQNYQVLYSLAESPGLNKNIRQSIENITRYLQDKILQSNLHEIDVAFYRDNIQALIHDDIPCAEDINNRRDITVERRREILALIEKCAQLNTLRMVINEMTSNNTSLESKQSEYEAIIKKLQNNCKEAEQRILQQQQKNKKISEEYKALLARQQKLKVRLQERKQQMSQALKNCQRLAQVNNFTLELNKTKEQELQKLKIQLSSFQQKSKIFSVQSLEESTLLKKQLQKKSSYIDQIQNELLEKTNHFQKQLEDKHLYIAQIENQFSILSQQNAQLKLKTEELSNSRLKSLLNKSRKAKSQLFIDSNSLIQHFQLDENSADSLIENVKKIVGEVTLMTSLFNFSLHKGENFHKRVDNRSNILLLCLTEEGRIVGGFTSAGFSLKNQDKNTKAFIFSFEDGNMKSYKLKPGKKSTIYDTDFLIFGNQQLCIERKTNKLNSRFVNGQKSLLHYEWQKGDDRQKFLTIQGDDKTSVKLKNYEIIELTISK